MVNACPGSLFQLVWRNSCVSDHSSSRSKVDAIFDHFWQLDEHLRAWNTAEVFSGSDPKISKILKTKNANGCVSVEWYTKKRLKLTSVGRLKLENAVMAVVIFNINSFCDIFWIQVKHSCLFLEFYLANEICQFIRKSETVWNFRLKRVLYGEGLIG